MLVAAPAFADNYVNGCYRANGTCVQCGSIEHGLTQQQFASEAINMMFAHGAGAPNNAFDRVITRSVGDEGTDGHLSVSGWTTTGET